MKELKHEQAAPLASCTKTAGLLWCAGVGLGSVLLLKATSWLAHLLPLDNIQRFAFVPENWWLVDERLTYTAIYELLALGVFAMFLRWRGTTLSALGFRRFGTRRAWVAAAVILVLGLLSHPFVRNGSPYPLTLYTLYAAAMIGVPVALFEEARVALHSRRRCWRRAALGWNENVPVHDAVARGSFVRVDCLRVHAGAGFARLPRSREA